jgi:hypothetical protein
MDIIMFSVHICCNQIVFNMFVLYLLWYVHHTCYYMCNIFVLYVLWFVYHISFWYWILLPPKSVIFLGRIFPIILGAWRFLILQQVIRCCWQPIHNVLFYYCLHHPLFLMRFHSSTIIPITFHTICLVYIRIWTMQIIIKLTIFPRLIAPLKGLDVIALFHLLPYVYYPITLYSFPPITICTIFLLQLWII